MLLVLTLTLLLSGCGYYDPPGLEDADAFLKSNRQEIDTVANYLKTIETDYAYIGNVATVFYEFKDHDILSENVRTSLQNLWSAGCKRITMEKADNTVYFEIWNRTRGGVSCGISCTLDGQGFPKAELQTACEPISGGWFYYYSDYEEYRKSPSKYDAMWNSQSRGD